MKLVCLAQVYNENTHKGPDGKTNLERFMRSVSKYCDGLIIYNDGSTDDSREFILDYPLSDRLRHVEVIGDPKNDFKNEVYHKARLLEHARRFRPDWLLWLDCDEIIEAKGERGAIQYLIETSKSDGINLFNRNLWRSDRYFRTDELWGVGLFCRLWRMKDELHYIIKSGLHQDLVPKGVVTRDDVNNLFVIHYGYASDDAILRKYELYKSHGQSGRSLDRMIDEKGLRLNSCPPEWFSDSGWPYSSSNFTKTPLVRLLNEASSNTSSL